MGVNEGTFINPEEHRHDSFFTIESNRFPPMGTQVQARFLVGLSDWGAPSFATFVVEPSGSRLVCGANDKVYLVDALSGEFIQKELPGFFRGIILVSSTSLIVEAEVGIYSLSWDLDPLWTVSTDLIQSVKVVGPQLAVETDAEILRVDLESGALLS